MQLFPNRQTLGLPPYPVIYDTKRSKLICFLCHTDFGIRNEGNCILVLAFKTILSEMSKYRSVQLASFQGDIYVLASAASPWFLFVDRGIFSSSRTNEKDNHYFLNKVHVCW